jgi:S-adenosyl-L-methionine hydrolase (adenosine-forming)
MGVITLISDWGHNDYYTAAVKGMIYKHYPEAIIVDITHEINPFDVDEAAYVIRNAYKSFPDNTVHIIGVNTEESLNHPHSIVYYNKQYFIGSDNGVFSLIFDDEPEKQVVLDVLQDSNHFTFSGRDRFVKAAVHLAKGGELSELGTERVDLTKRIPFEPVKSENLIRGLVIHIDTYENLITNIPEALFRETVRRKKFEISLRSIKLRAIHNSYGDVRPGEVVALFASHGLLEIAINKANAASLLGVHKKDPIIIEVLSD